MSKKKLLMSAILLLLCFSHQAKAILIAGNLDEPRMIGRIGFGKYDEETTNVTPARPFTTND